MVTETVSNRNAASEINLVRINLLILKDMNSRRVSLYFAKGSYCWKAMLLEKKVKDFLNFKFKHTLSWRKP